MKAELSIFLKDNKELLQELVNSLSKEYKYVSLLGIDTIGTGYNTSIRGSGVNDSNWKDRGFVVRVFNGVNYSEYSFNRLDDMDYVKNRIKEIAKSDITVLLNKGVTLIDFPLIKDENMIDDYSTEYERDPFSISAKDKLNTLQDIMTKGLAISDKFIDFRVSYEEVKISKIFLSTEKDLSQAIVYTNMHLVAIARNENGIKYDFEGLSGLKGYEIIDEAYSRIEKVANSVLELLDSKRVIPGEYEIICDPNVSGLIAHEAFGHGVEMDMFVKKRAKGEEYINKKIASDKVNMRDGALSGVEVGTYLFDDEGTLGTDTLVIENSILRAGISDLLSALKLGTTPTGNGRRESFERKAYARMTNTFFEGGKDTLEDMIKSVKKGYVLEGFFSGMEDPKNWGIQCVLAKGREIIDGKFTGEIVSPVTLTGYVPDLLQSIDMVSNDELYLSGTGACGKGHKEWVKTSTGGTYIKAIGRLS